MNILHRLNDVLVKNIKLVKYKVRLDRYYNGVEKYSKDITKPDDEIWIIYAGTLGSSYDLVTLLDTAKRVESERSEKIKFKILGQGPDGDALEAYVENKKIKNVEFLGFQPYEKMAAYLCKSYGNL